MRDCHGVCCIQWRALVLRALFIAMLISLLVGCRPRGARQIIDHGGSYIPPPAGSGIDAVAFGGRGPFGDQDFAAVYPTLAKLSDLQRLALGGTDITDESLELISRLRQVENLSLINTRVTAAGLKQLRVMPRLRYLYIPTTITDAELSELQRQMPQVRVSRRSTN